MAAADPAGGRLIAITRTIEIGNIAWTPLFAKQGESNMKVLNELLGFAVLTGPLWLILIVLAIAIWIAVKVAKRFERRGAKIAVGALMFLLIFFVPFADEIAGRIYLSRLCATEAGVKVYQTVELSAEYWDEEGKPKFLNSRGILVKAVLGDRFKWRNVSEPYINWFIKIDKERWFLQDNQSKQDLGEKITFLRHYGWLNQFSPASTLGESCRNIWAERYGRDVFFQKENSEERNFLLRMFTPPASSK